MSVSRGLEALALAGLFSHVPRIAKYKQAAFPIQIIIFQGQFSIISAFLMENSKKQLAIYIAICSTGGSGRAPAQNIMKFIIMINALIITKYEFCNNKLM